MSVDSIESKKVYKSVKNKKWTQSTFDPRLALTIYQKTGLPQIFAEMLSTRNIDVEYVSRFLDPKLKDLLPNPFSLLDMRKAVESIAQAILHNKKIVIFGDYDVDGATSSALLANYFKQIGVKADIYIPDRILEGYGPSTQAFQVLKNQGAALIITVDCGTLSYEPIAAANDMGIEVIVVDHHIGGTELPLATAVINPNRIDETTDLKYLAAVGVCFLLIVAVSAHLKEINFFNNNKEPNLLQLLDLVALGTICDQVPLIGLNRALVRQGIKIINNKQNLGLRSLIEIAGINDNISTYHLGFVIGPRINAGGRVGQAPLGATLLSCDDKVQAMKIARQLSEYNEERKAIELMVLEQAILQAEKLHKNDPIIFVIGEDWHPGVIGIVASRLKDKFNKPTAVISLVDGVGKASCRSVTGIDFGAAVMSAKLSGLLVAGGGHAMAAGFTVNLDKITDLKEFFCNSFNQNYKDLLNASVNYFDTHLTLSSTNIDFINLIDRLGPFGSGNFQPRFMISNVNIVRADIVGGEHISCILSEGNGSSCKIKAIAFRALDNPISEVLLSKQRFNLTLIVSLGINRWNGAETPEMIIQDLIVN
jgi:single-stranded-DNA-specific exonuclease